MKLTWTIVFAIALASCGKPQPLDAAPVAALGPVETLQRVCAAPSSHQAVLAAAKALHWREVASSRLPSEMVTTGSVSWTGAWETTLDGKPLYLAIGDHSGASHCALRFSDTDPRTVREQLSALEVLGAPLGAPDDERTLDGVSGWASQKLVGWHLSREKSWRTVHLMFGGKAEADNAPPGLVLAMTRPVP